MDILIAWGLLGGLIRVFDEFAGVVVPIALVLGGVGFLSLRDRVSRAERRLAALEAGAHTSVPTTASPAATPAGQQRTGSRAIPPPESAPVASARAATPRPAPDLGYETADAVVTETPGASVDAPTAVAASEGWLASMFSGGNWLIRGGVLVLFVGVGFLLKFAADHALLPVWLRLCAVGASGLAMVLIGLRVTPHRAAYGLALQGGGIGLVYLTLYAAFRLYALLPGGLALSLMIAVVIAAGALALRQNAIVLAVLGALGGFAAPVLASTGTGDHVLLFGYYCVLNLGVLGLALTRTWRALNVVGFVSTFGVSAFWGHRFYDPTYFASTEPFLIVFFVLYLGVAVAFALKRALELRDPMDATVVFGTPLAAFGLQSQLVAGMPHALTSSAIALAAIYALLATWLHRRDQRSLDVLMEAFVALAIGFFTVAIALAFDARWTAASWALEGAALVWVGCRQRRALARLAGAALQLLAGGAWLWHAVSHTSFGADDFSGTVLLAIAGLVSSASNARSRVRGEGGADALALTIALGLWGLAWWFGGALLEIGEVVPSEHRTGAAIAVFALSALALDLIGARFAVTAFRHAALGLPVMLALIALVHPLSADHPLEALAGLAWPGAIAITLALARRHEGRYPVWLAIVHAFTFWTVVALLGWELYWHFHSTLSVQVWRLSAWLLAPAAALAGVAWACERRWPWPFTAHARDYLVFAMPPVACALAVAMLLLNVVDPGAEWPIAHVPLLNVLDLAMIAGFAALALWIRAVPRPFAGLSRVALIAPVAALGFVWINAVLLRTLHFVYGIEYAFDALFTETVVQSALSVLWASTALVMMVLGSRRAWRVLWITGSVLMGVVMLKLFLVDLASTGTIARIVSFISVGLLLLLVGWMAPVPPKSARDTATPA